MTVGNCRLDDSMWPESSRGPGELFGQGGAGSKPDVVAPTPKGGHVLWGPAICKIDQWGTSGACPQVAGLAALLWTAEPSLRVDELFQAIRRGARDLGHDPNCQGAGMINCLESLAWLGAI